MRFFQTTNKPSLKGEMKYFMKKKKKEIINTVDIDGGIVTPVRPSIKSSVQLLTLNMTSKVGGATLKLVLIISALSITTACATSQVKTSVNNNHNLNNQAMFDSDDLKVGITTPFDGYDYDQNKGQQAPAPTYKPQVEHSTPIDISASIDTTSTTHSAGSNSYVTIKDQKMLSDFENKRLPIDISVTGEMQDVPTPANDDVQITNTQEDQQASDEVSEVQSQEQETDEMNERTSSTIIIDAFEDEANKFTEYKYDYPRTIDSLALSVMKRLTTSQKTIFQLWIERANKYSHIVENILYDEGVPSDLIALPLVESGYNPYAVSRVGAVGMWQFMRYTAINYGMRIDYWVDERKDFEKSTRAAAQYLKDSYSRFHNWDAATASYNAGPGKIGGLIKQYKSNDFYDFYQSKSVKAETKFYVPKFSSMLTIYRNYLKYGFAMPKTNPLVYKTLNVTHQYNLYYVANVLNCSVIDLFELNPGLNHPVTPPGDYFLRVPYTISAEKVKELLETDEYTALQMRFETFHVKTDLQHLAKTENVDYNTLYRINGNLRYISANVPIAIPLGSFDESLNDKFSINSIYKVVLSQHDVSITQTSKR